MTANPASYTEKQLRTAQRVLDSLDRWDRRLEEHYAPQRQHERKGFRALITVRLPPTLNPAEEPTGPLCFQAWARNISQSGLSFIHPGEVKQRFVLVCLQSPEGKASWFRAEVVRARVVQDGFWEYGVLFRGRAVV